MDSASTAIEIDCRLRGVPIADVVSVRHPEPAPAPTAPAAADAREYVAHVYAAEPYPELYAGSYPTGSRSLAVALRRLWMELPDALAAEELDNIQELTLRLEPPRSGKAELTVSVEACRAFGVWRERLVAQVREASGCTELAARAHVHETPEVWRDHWLAGRTPAVALAAERRVP